MGIPGVVVLEVTLGVIMQGLRVGLQIPGMGVPGFVDGQDPRRRDVTTHGDMRAVTVQVFDVFTQRATLAVMLSDVQIPSTRRIGVELDMRALVQGVLGGGLLVSGSPDHVGFPVGATTGMLPAQALLPDRGQGLLPGVVPQSDVALRDGLRARLRGQMLPELLVVEGALTHLKGSFRRARRTLTLLGLIGFGSGTGVSANCLEV
jgi:hypothetical protein